MAGRRTERDDSKDIWQRGHSLQRLMASVALISFGLGFYMTGVAGNPYGGVVTIFALFISGALIGAGVLTPFHETEIGVFAGVAVVALYLGLRLAWIF